MTGNGTAHQDIVFLREYLDDLQALHLHPVTAHPARHADTLHNAARVRGVTKGTGSARTVMLTMRLPAHPMESVTLNDTLETFTLRCADYFDFITFGENVNSNRLTK